MADKKMVTNEEFSTIVNNLTNGRIGNASISGKDAEQLPVKEEAEAIHPQITISGNREDNQAFPEADINFEEAMGTFNANTNLDITISVASEVNGYLMNYDTMAGDVESVSITKWPAKLNITSDSSYTIKNLVFSFNDGLKDFQVVYPYSLYAGNSSMNLATGLEGTLEMDNPEYDASVVFNREYEISDIIEDNPVIYFPTLTLDSASQLYVDNAINSNLVFVNSLELVLDNGEEYIRVLGSLDSSNEDIYGTLNFQYYNLRGKVTSKGDSMYATSMEIQTGVTTTAMSITAVNNTVPVTISSVSKWFDKNSKWKFCGLRYNYVDTLDTSNAFSIILNSANTNTNLGLYNFETNGTGNSLSSVTITLPITDYVSTATQNAQLRTGDTITNRAMATNLALLLQDISTSFSLTEDNVQVCVQHSETGKQYWINGGISSNTKNIIVNYDVAVHEDKFSLDTFLSTDSLVIHQTDAYKVNPQNYASDLYLGSRFNINIEDLSDEHNGLTVYCYFLRYETTGGAYGGSDMWFGFTVPVTATTQLTIGQTIVPPFTYNSSMYPIKAFGSNELSNGVIMDGDNFGSSSYLYVGSSHMSNASDVLNFIVNEGFNGRIGEVYYMHIVEITALCLISGHFEPVNLWNYTFGGVEDSGTVTVE